MKIAAIIEEINDVREGTNQRTGNPWKRQEIVITWTDAFGEQGETRRQELFVTLRGRSLDLMNERGYNVGDMITGEVDFYTRKYGDKTYNDITLNLE